MKIVLGFLSKVFTYNQGTKPAALRWSQKAPFFLKEEAEEEEEEEEKTDIKSNNPHLIGGEKQLGQGEHFYCRYHYISHQLYPPFSLPYNSPSHSPVIRQHRRYHL